MQPGIWWGSHMEWRNVGHWWCFNYSNVQWTSRSHSPLSTSPTPQDSEATDESKTNIERSSKTTLTLILLAFWIWKQPRSRCHLRGKQCRSFLKACWYMQVQTDRQTPLYRRSGHVLHSKLLGLLLNFLNQRVKTKEQLTDAAVDIRKNINMSNTERNVTQCVHISAHGWWK